MSDANEHRTTAMGRVLNRIDKGERETEASPNGVLARFWRVLLKDLRVSMDIWNQKVSEYIEVYLPTNAARNEIMNARSMINKELAESTITFKVFMTGLKVLGILRVRIILKADWPTGKTTEHSLDIKLAKDEDAQLLINKYQARERLRELATGGKDKKS